MQKLSPEITTATTNNNDYNAIVIFINIKNSYY